MISFNKIAARLTELTLFDFLLSYAYLIDLLRQFKINLRHV